MLPVLRTVGILISVVILVVVSGCTEETDSLKQKIATLEKRLAKQEKDFGELAGKIAVPKDFSVDLRRIEDEQERLAQSIDGKLEPVNSKLDEFREWAQEAQRDRTQVAKKMADLEGSYADFRKTNDGLGRELSHLKKEFSSANQKLAANTKSLAELSAGVNKLHKEVLDNNTKLIEAVKKTIPKVKEAAVAETKEGLVSLEKKMAAMKAGLEGDLKSVRDGQTGQSIPSRVGPPPGGREVQALERRLRELEEIVTAQKALLLDMGSKIFALEKAFTR
jgi:chromosome segregation ATPase